MELTRTLKLKDLILFNIIAMVGLRWIALSSSEAGWAALLLWGLAIIAFFVPHALAVSELNRLNPVTGGLYVWTKDALGDFNGFMSGWCYWTNNFIYYPSLLGFVAPTLAFLVGRDDLASDNFFVMGMILILLWVAVIVNVFGLKPTKRMEGLGGITTIVVFAILAVLAVVFTSSNGIQNSFAPSDLIPEGIGSVRAWSALCFALAGFELVSTLGEEIVDPKKTVYKSIVISAIGIAVIYLLGTFFVMASMPKTAIKTDIGIQQTLYSLGDGVGAPQLGGIGFILIIIGGMAGVGAWLAGTSRVSYEVGVNKRLPKFFSALHPRWKTPHWSILFQGIIASILTVIAYTWAKPGEKIPIGETAIGGLTTSAAYNILVDMTLIIYLIPFVYLFLSFLAIKLKDRSGEKSLIPGGRAMVWVLGILGLVSTVIAVILPFVDLIVDFNWQNMAILVGGTALFLGAGVIVYFLSPGREEAKG
jgi:amino acid transporter